MKSINIIAIMPFLASSFMTQAPVYQDVNHLFSIKLYMT